MSQMWIAYSFVAMIAAIPFAIIFGAWIGGKIKNIFHAVEETEDKDGV